ncbi:hypothetical protein PTKIN_Ptkin15bG0015900 [Pterospermum kingtungense]
MRKMPKQRRRDRNHEHDHYATTSSSDDEGVEEEDDLSSRSEIGTRLIRGESEKLHHFRDETPPPAQLQWKQQMYKAVNKIDSKSEGSSAKSYRMGVMMGMKMVVRHKDLKEILDLIKENFDKADSVSD